MAYLRKRIHEAVMTDVDESTIGLLVTTLLTSFCKNQNFEVLDIFRRNNNAPHLTMVRRLDVGIHRRLVGTVDDRHHDVGPTPHRPGSANGWQHGIGPASARSLHAIGGDNAGMTASGQCMRHGYCQPFCDAKQPG